MLHLPERGGDCPRRRSTGRRPKPVVNKMLLLLMPPCFLRVRVRCGGATSAAMLLLDVLATYLAICARFAPCSALQVERQRPDRTAPACGEVLLMPWGRREF